MPRQAGKAQRSGPSGQNDGRLKGCASIVVVDDRATNRSILTKLAYELAERVEVEAFGDVDAALAAVVDSPPDLLITDYKMPNLNGAEFVRRLRDAPKCFDVPVIVVTAYEDKQYRYDALQAGASDFLLTPVDRLEFVQRGRNLLTMRRQQQELTRQAKARERRLKTANRLRQRELRFSEEKFRLVIDTVPALVNATDADGRLAFVNAYHTGLFGVDPSDAAGADPADVLPADYARRHIDAAQRVFESGQPLSFEERVLGRDGVERTLLTSKAPLHNAAGEIANVVTVAVDISEQKRAEWELAEAKDEAQSANRAKSEFLANVSHELRTPLNAVMGFADVTRRELLGPLGCAQYREYQEDIYASGNHLMRLIEDLLDLSRLDLGRLEARPQCIDVAATAEREVRAVAQDASTNGLHLGCEVASGAESLVSDPGRFRQILANLLSNAVKYTQCGGTIRLQVRPAAGGGVRVEIVDDGPGMDDEEIKVALSRFGRLGSVATHDQPGAGLGLPIAADLASLLNGSLQVDSAPGAGTRVIVELPDMALPPDYDDDDGDSEADAMASASAGGRAS